MPTLKEQVEQRAKELRELSDIISDNEEGTLDLIFESKTLAKHCIASELRAKINELTVLLLDPEMDMGLDRIIRNRITELQDQLSALENL